MRIALCDDDKNFLTMFRKLMEESYPDQDKLYISEFESIIPKESGRKENHPLNSNRDQGIIQKNTYEQNKKIFMDNRRFLHGGGHFTVAAECLCKKR